GLVGVVLGSGGAGRRVRCGLIVGGSLEDGNVVGTRTHDSEAAIGGRRLFLRLALRPRLRLRLRRLLVFGWRRRRRRRRRRLRRFGFRARERRAIRLVIAPGDERALLAIRLDRLWLQGLV